MESKSEPLTQNPSGTTKEMVADANTKNGPLPVELTNIECEMIRKINPPFLNCGGGRSSVPVGFMTRFAPCFRQGPLQLTSRQAMVAYGVAIGLTNKEIASGLEITEQTVKDHVSVLMRKAKFAPGDGSRVRLATWYLGIGSL